MEKSNRFKVEIESTTLECEPLETDVVKKIIIDNLKHHFEKGDITKITPCYNVPNTN